jgi:hypothetical protein
MALGFGSGAQKINEVEAILKRLTDQVQRKIVAGQGIVLQYADVAMVLARSDFNVGLPFCSVAADLEAETQLWKSVKSLSADWGKSDFLIGLCFITDLLRSSTRYLLNEDPLHPLLHSLQRNFCPKRLKSALLSLTRSKRWYATCSNGCGIFL